MAYFKLPQVSEFIIGYDISVPLGDFRVATYHIKMSEGCQCPTKKINEDVKCFFSMSIDAPFNLFQLI